MYHRKKLTAIAIIAFIAVFSSVWAQSKPTSETRVSLKLQDADLRTALQLIMQQTGAEFVMLPTDKPYAKITNLNLTDKPLETALEYICMAAGASLEKRDAVYVIGPITEKPVSSDTNTVAEVKTPPAKPQIITEKIYCRHVDPRLILNALRYEHYAEISPEPMTEAQMLRSYRTEKRDNHPIMLPNTGSNNAVYENGQTTTPSMPAPESMNFGTSANQMNDNPLTSAFQVRPPSSTPPPGTTPAQTTQTIPGIEFIQALMSDNSIIAQGTYEAIEELKRRIRMYDVAPKQVMIKVEFITTKEDITKSFGINWQFQRVNFTAGATGLADAGSPVYVNYASGNVIANLRTSLTEGKGRVIQSPIITTMNNVPAIIETQTELTFFVNQTVITGNGQVVTFPDRQDFTVDTTLQVTPRVNADGTITLFLDPQLGDTVGVSRSPDGTEIPNRVFQRIAVLRRIKSGETMVLGGLTRKSDADNVTKVPILADLPIIGSLFRSTKVQQNVNELLIFVTPIILEEPETEGAGTMFP